MSRYTKNSGFLGEIVLVFVLVGCLVIAYQAHVTELSPELDLWSEPPTCRQVHRSTDQCQFVRSFCGDENNGLLSYLGLYYCQLAKIKPLALIIIVAWLAILFTTLGIAAGDYFAVNLSVLAHSLHMSDTLAGVTLLALGNGAPDIFSTLAAMNSNSQSMALGELIGAALFITSVVAGTMGVVRTFPVVRGSFIRDATFLTLTIVFLIYVMSDGVLRFWHATFMLSLYFLYVATVSVWHWYLSRKTRKIPEDGAGAQPSPSGDPAEAVASARTSSITTEAEAIRGPKSKHPGQQRSRKVHRTIFDDEDAIEAPAETVDYRYINPSLLKTLAFRHEHRYMRGPEQQSERNALLPRTTHRKGNYGSAESGRSQYSRSSPIYADNHHGEHEGVSKDPKGSSKLMLTLFPILEDFWEKSTFHKLASILTAPSLLVLGMTIPVTGGDNEDGQDEYHWDRNLCIIQSFFAPQFLLAVASHQLGLDLHRRSLPSLCVLGGSTAFAVLVLIFTASNKEPRWFRLACVPGFIVSVAWISLIADEMVSILKALGVICSISEAVLGLTVFAVGNSFDDLAANLSVAQHRHPMMALSASFGGPLLNILLGVSLAGFFALSKQAKEGQRVPGIDLGVDRTLFVSAGLVLFTIAVIIFMMLWTKWKMNKTVGYSLIAIWIAGTAANLAVHLLVK